MTAVPHSRHARSNAATGLTGALWKPSRLNAVIGLSGAWTGERVLRELPKSHAATLGEFCAETDAFLSVERGRTLMLIRHLLARKRILFPLHAEEINLDQPLRLFRTAGAK